MTAIEDPKTLNELAAWLKARGFSISEVSDADRAVHRSNATHLVEGRKFRARYAFPPAGHPLTAQVCALVVEDVTGRER